jgi:hypothetical protein
VSSVTDLISIVDADDDLAELIDDAQRERARREALTRARRRSNASGDDAAPSAEERDQGQDRDQEQKRMDDNTAGDGDDQQDDCECEKHAHLRIGFLHISPAHRGQNGRGYRFRRLNADVAGRRSTAIRLRAS